MHTINTQIEIDAPAKQVWKVIADVASYPEWNPFVTEWKGGLAPGEKITIHMAQPGSKPVSLRPTVLKVDADREVVWKGRVLLPGLFDAEHHLEIEPSGPDQCVFRQYEVFRGLLVPFMKSMLDQKTKRGFEQMNRALKERSENVG